MNKEFLVIRETNNDPLRSKLLYCGKERETAGSLHII
jgi:hypothetical protein